MEGIRVELSMKRDSSELYGSTENPFAVIAGRLARIFERETDETETEKERESERSDVGRQYSLAVISSTKATHSISLFPPFPSFLSRALTLCTLMLFTKPLVRSSNLNSLADTAESNRETDNLSNHNDWRNIARCNISSCTSTKSTKKLICNQMYDVDDYFFVIERSKMACHGRKHQIWNIWLVISGF